MSFQVAVDCLFSSLHSFPLYECFTIYFSFYYWWALRLLSSICLLFLPLGHVSLHVPVNSPWLAKGSSALAPNISFSSLAERFSDTVGICTALCRHNAGVHWKGSSQLLRMESSRQTPSSLASCRTVLSCVTPVSQRVLRRLDPHCPLAVNFLVCLSSLSLFHYFPNCFMGFKSLFVCPVWGEPKLKFQEEVALGKEPGYFPLEFWWSFGNKSHVAGGC